jgi:bacteriocin-like protein
MAKTEKSRKPKASPDALIKPTKKGEIELTEDELDKVSGGPTAVEYRNNIKI